MEPLSGSRNTFLPLILSLALQVSRGGLLPPNDSRSRGLARRHQWQEASAEWRVMKSQNSQTKSPLSTKRTGGESPRQPRCVFMTHAALRTGRTGEITAAERLFSINIYLFFQRNSLNISLTQSELICLHIPGSIWRRGGTLLPS